jgi:hypothetical protein
VATEITERTNIAFIFRVEGMTWLFSGPVYLSKMCQCVFRRMFCAVYLRRTRKCTGLAIKGLNSRGTSAARIVFAGGQVLESDATHPEVVPPVMNVFLLRLRHLNKICCIGNVDPCFRAPCIEVVTFYYKSE